MADPASEPGEGEVVAPDPLDQLVERLVEDGGATMDAFTEGRRFGAFYAGLRSSSKAMQFPLTLSAGVALTEAWMVGDIWIGDDVDDDEDEAEDDDDDE